MSNNYTNEELTYANNWIQKPEWVDDRHYVVYYRYEGTNWYKHYFNKCADAYAFYNKELFHRIIKYRIRFNSLQNQR